MSTLRELQTKLCEALQLPQSTVSRHLKVLADDGWVLSRADGASRLYRMPVTALEPAARKLWQLVRDQVESAPAALRDAERLRGVLADYGLSIAAVPAGEAPGLRAPEGGETRLEIERWCYRLYVR